jgi:quinoprotein glucose dehydrogenase
MRYALALALILFFSGKDRPDIEWTEYLGGPDRNHYSPLEQVNRSNVSKLKKAWEYHTGDTSGQMQCNPIIVDGLLYGTSASIEVFALEPFTGKEVWRFRNAGDVKWYSLSRGVSYWAKGEDKRIFFTAGEWLYALNAKSGELVKSFGNGGRVSLKTGLGESAQSKFVISSTPGAIFENLIIMPLRLSEGADAAPGYIQAFDVETGKVQWVFKTIPSPGEYGYETWEKGNHLNEEIGGANSWAGMSVDHKRGMIFVPTGSAAFDFYGGNRKGDNLFANCLLALDARTGNRKWHFQFVHHDVWDRDLPSSPNLMTINQKGKSIDVVVQATKAGFLYVFDRVTGKPIFDIKEVVVPVDGVPGEQLSATQPIPVRPQPFARTEFREEDLNPWAENLEELRATYRKLRKGLFQPPSYEGTLIFPGYDGGAEWGGSAVDPETGLYYINSHEIPCILKISDNKKYLNSSITTGNKIYLQYCSSCHKPDFSGSPQSGIPSLADIGKRKDASYIESIITQGKGMMTGFPQMSAGQREAVVGYLLRNEKISRKEENTPQKGVLPYVFDGYTRFLDKNGYPAVKPPWGQLTAINLNTGEIVWQKVLGEYRELTAKGIPQTGADNYGGAVVTKGGLVFIAATKDERIRAFDKSTGKLLWEAELPACGFATPSVYESNGKQFLVVACGGTKLGAKKGDSYVAFAL